MKKVIYLQKTENRESYNSNHPVNGNPNYSLSFRYVSESPIEGRGYYIAIRNTVQYKKTVCETPMTPYSSYEQAIIALEKMVLENFNEEIEISDWILTKRTGI